jgi:hypothetical protein
MTALAEVAQRRRDIAARPWKGAQREYDLFKELTIGVVVVGALVLGLAGIAGSPDEPSVTLRSWAIAAPNDLIATATSELAGTSGTAQYGPPYTSTPGATQTLGPIDLQSLSGVRRPIDPASAFVTAPLALLHEASSALASWNGATRTTRTAWATAYSDALAHAARKAPSAVKPGSYGPVPALTAALLAAARSGALDTALQSNVTGVSTDASRSILFLGDGEYFPTLAAGQHLTGDQWGVMNETGNYPGQSWLWLFSFWYQVPLIGALPNADLVVVALMLLLTTLLALVPVIPGLRSLPRWIPIHRLIWRDYYRRR